MPILRVLFRGRIRVTAVVMLVLLVAACNSGGVEEDPILRLSAEEALAKGKELMEARKYGRAGEYLIHAFEVAPNSASGREALLLSADALYQSGGPSNFIKAAAKYRDFLNRFPTSDRGAYVQLQIANCLAKRVLRADRDQSTTLEAVEAYRGLLRLYPGSEQAEEAQLQIQQLRGILAEHEFLVGHHNFRRRLFGGATARFEALLEEYPEYPKRDRVLYFLGLSYQRMGQPEKASAVFERLREEFSDSVYVAQIPEREE
ncbi:MAG: outer membrane protein assembly factor BamD [Thermoanaerobaculia bacterium]